MAVITIPTAVADTIGGQSYGQARYDIMETSEPTGAAAVRVLGPPRWTFGLTSKQGMNLADAGEWEAMLLRLRGGINHLAVYDRLRTAPQGRMRGATVLNASAAIGATNVSIAFAAGLVNLLPFSRTFDRSDAWTGNATVTANTTLPPNVTVLGAETINDTDAGVLQFRQQVITVVNDANSYNASIYVKQTSGATAPTFALGVALSGGTGVVNNPRLNTDTGAIISGTASATLVDGYWRLDAPIANNATGNTVLTITLYPAIAAYGLSTADATRTGSKIVWGAQVSLGATVQSYETFSGYVLPGDWLQIGTGVGASQLVKVIDSQSANSDTGLVSCNFEPPLRYAFSAGAAVTWDKPVAYCKLTNSRLSWAARANGPAIDGFAADLLEDWG